MTAEHKTRVSVMIYGTEYKLMGRASKSPAYLQMIAATVNEQMHKIADKAPHLDMPRIAVLTAVNIADEMNQLKDSVQQSQQEESKELRSMEQQVAQLTAENEQLKQDISRRTEQFNDSRKQRERLENELSQLREEHKQVQAELKQQLLANKQAQQPDDDIMEKYKRLEEEYGKLQTEYNEWIQLLDREDPVS